MMLKYRRQAISKLLSALHRRPSVGLVCTVAIIVMLALSHVSSTSAATSTPGPITAGPSRSECLVPDIAPGAYGLSIVQSAISSFDTETDSTVSCITAYFTDAQTWSQWDHPWITSRGAGYSSWVAQQPKSRELVLAFDLMPASLQNVNDPLNWERSCAAGEFDSYATTLGKSLVGAGLGNSVLRLGPEMNGMWETDFVGTTRGEQRLWAKCFAKEVTSLRHVAGGHFLIDWNPNACVENYPYANFYPGNKSVDIVGLDFYDISCNTPTVPVTFQELTDEPAGLGQFEAFARAHHKPMSFPEWGLMSSPNGDDPAYVDGVGAAVASGDFAFQSYFDANESGASSPSVMILGPTTPLSLVNYQKWFGSTP